MAIPGCRDCADHDGICPHDGHACGEDTAVAMEPLDGSRHEFPFGREGHRVSAHCPCGPDCIAVCPVCQGNEDQDPACGGRGYVIVEPGSPGAIVRHLRLTPPPA